RSNTAHFLSSKAYKIALPGCTGDTQGRFALTSYRKQAKLTWVEGIEECPAIFGMIKTQFQSFEGMVSRLVICMQNMHGNWNIRAISIRGHGSPQKVVFEPAGAWHGYRAQPDNSVHSDHIRCILSD